MKELIFGNTYIVSKKYIKCFGYHKDRHSRGWMLKDFEPKSGIYLGKRVISEGFTSEGVFMFENSITVLLFACDKRGLIYVPINNIKI
jgi:hypothetical protein